MWALRAVMVLGLVAVLMAGCEMEKPPPYDNGGGDGGTDGDGDDDGTIQTDPAVRTHCVNVEHLRAPFLVSFDWRQWEWDFVNSCGESVRVRWFTQRSRYGLAIGSGWATSLDVGERDSNYGLWSQNSNPPNPITVWCAYVGTSSDPCYRENSYLTNPTNWREMHY